MARLARYAAAVATLLATGCAGGRLYDHGINHAYLCAVRVVKARGYQVREQDFKPDGGTLIAARSTPDPRETKMEKGYFKRAGEVLSNMWEKGKFEMGDEDQISYRIRTEERVVAEFKAGKGGMFGWIGRKDPEKARIKVKVDLTDYGRDDWILKRKNLGKGPREELYDSFDDCLGLPNPSTYGAKRAVAPAAASPVTAAPALSATVVAVAPAGPMSSTVPEADEERPAQPVKDLTEVLNKARTAYDGAKFEEATGLLEQVVLAEPENAEALGYLGASYYQLKKFDQAIDMYERYIKLVPSDTGSRDFLREMKDEKKEREVER